MRATLLNTQGTVDEVPGEIVHELRSEHDSKEEEWKGAKTMTAAEVNACTGREAERWRVATEKEYVDNFVQRNVYTVASGTDVRRCGPPLPMKCVYNKKAPNVCKVRAVVCGNYERADPSQALWTAQAETSSLVSAFRLGLLRSWSFGTLDVSGAFMYAPLPENVSVLIMPPKAFVQAGLVKHGELWLLQKAVYGLRVAPRAWGKERDRVLRALKWGDGGYLEQCHEDTQVWKIRKQGVNGICGLIVVYVDDYLLAALKDENWTLLKQAMREHWAMKDEVLLDDARRLTFIGIEVQLEADGLRLHQSTFANMLLDKYGLTTAKPITSVTMEVPSNEEIPTDVQLRELQTHAGDLNWLQTRTRADLSYYTICSPQSNHRTPVGACAW